MKATHYDKGRMYRPIKARFDPHYYHNVFSEHIEAAIAILLREGSTTITIKNVDKRIKDIIEDLFGEECSFQPGGVLNPPSDWKEGEKVLGDYSEYEEQAIMIAKKKYPSFYTIDTLEDLSNKYGY
jgi:hypothetical protein